MEKVRAEFVQAAMEQEESFSALCREYGISRKTGYKWLERHKNGYGLSDQSRQPFTTPNKTPEEIEQAIVEYRGKHPAWGAKKIKENLEKSGMTLPCIKTVNNILKRYGCISEEQSLKHTPFKRFEHNKSNQLWQTDFKGEFKMENGQYCYPLDIVDDHSRFLIHISAHQSMKNVVIPMFREAFIEFGLPDAILSDNGAQFAGFRHGFTQFEKWLMNHDVLPIHGRILHPQTQGKIERLHRTMKEEVLKFYTPKDIEDSQSVFDKWREEYNTIRPHEALGMRYPAQVYEASTRRYTDHVEPYEYSGEFNVIKVNKWGYVRFDKFQTFLSETMAGEYIEFRPNLHGDSLTACYRNFSIAEFDALSGELLHRKISKLP